LLDAGTDVAALNGWPAGPAFIKADASERPLGTNSLAAKALSREQLIRKLIAITAFALCDCIYAQDE